jgi:hypothetical protein
MEVGKYDPKTTPDRRKEIRSYIGQIPYNLYTDDDASGEVWNLTHLGFAEENPLPDLFPESRMDFARFNKFVKAVTLFYYNDRMEAQVKDRDAIVSLLSTPADLWLAWKIFGEKMVLSALNLRDMDFGILDLLRGSSQSMTVAEVQTEMRKRGQNLSDGQVRGSLEGMLDKAYVFKDNSGGRVKYKPSPFATADQVSRDIQIDFQNIVDETKQTARDVLSESVAEEYITQFCQGEGLIETDPLGGEQVNITEQDLGETVDEQVDEESETIESTEPYGSGGDGDSAVQGTIG